MLGLARARHSFCAGSGRVRGARKNAHIHTYFSASGGWAHDGCYIIAKKRKNLHGWLAPALVLGSVAAVTFLAGHQSLLLTRSVQPPASHAALGNQKLRPQCSVQREHARGRAGKWRSNIR